MKLTKEETNKLKQNLPKNYGRLIADEIGCSTALVYYVLNGKRDNVRIVNKLLSLAEKTKEENDNTINKIKKL